MIKTYSCFYYGITITEENQWFDFDEGSGEISFKVEIGEYTLESLASEIERNLLELGNNTYTVTVNRASRFFTITSNASIDLLIDTGTNEANGIYETIGIVSAIDLTGTTFTSTVGIGKIYEPQFWLQGYVDEKDMRRLRSATKSVSTSGEVEVQSFGVDRMFRFSIVFATDIFQPQGSPIKNNQNGLDDLRSFMQYAITQGVVQFIPDISKRNQYSNVVLDSTPFDGNGLGYELQEQYARGMTGYFETGSLTFRILETIE